MRPAIHAFHGLAVSPWNCFAAFEKSLRRYASQPSHARAVSTSDAQNGCDITAVAAQLVSAAIDVRSRGRSGYESAARPCSSRAIAISARTPAGGPAGYRLTGQPAIAPLKSEMAARNPSELPLIVAPNSSQYPSGIHRDTAPRDERL